MLASIGFGVNVAPAAMADPTIGMRAARGTIEITRRPNRAAWLDPALSVVAVDGPFELLVTRTNYDEPLTLTRTLPGGEQVLDSEFLQEWWGLKNFLRIRITNSQGNVVKGRSLDFCPNSWDQQRVNDSGPFHPTYPYFCNGGPFTTGMVWGIDQGWATNIFEFGGMRFNGPDGRYTLTAWITRDYADAFGVPEELASRDVTVKLKTVAGGGGGCGGHCGHGRALAQEVHTIDVPVIANPDPAILPDLAALPAFAMSLSNGNKQFLRFGATVWLGGASGLHVEGFRQEGEDVMDAFQYFYENGEIIGKAPVGSFEYDVRQGHSHWHFRQFAKYRLISEDTSKVVRSKKEAFCLAPTDPIDLTLDGAQWRPDDIGFGGSNCGGESSLWVREVLPLGWGDTYHQNRPGQSFNVTGLEDGTYFLEVEANPGSLLHDASEDNDIVQRKVIIKTRNGKRTLRVPPWNGIDTD